VHHDICFGNPRQATNAVLLTTTDEGAAERIAAAINQEKDSLFQVEAKARAFVKKTDRGTPAAAQASAEPETPAPSQPAAEG
jgi:hypothetical protein